MPNEISADHMGVTVSYNPNWSGRPYTVSIEKTTYFVTGTTLEEATGLFRDKILSVEPDEDFRGSLHGMFSRLSEVLKCPALPTCFSTWDPDFPGGPMSVSVKVVERRHFRVGFVWDYGNKAQRRYEMYLTDDGDMAEAFLGQSVDVIEKYCESVRLWKAWTSESLEICSNAIQRLLAGGQETDRAPGAPEAKE